MPSSHQPGDFRTALSWANDKAPLARSSRLETAVLCCLISSVLKPRFSCLGSVRLLVLWGQGEGGG